ncbi:prepilin-type N-terminal cleavage/methylation domain-containing protein [Patescibacteria group bacterium]|nr:prepilin-type N-terminal cleavage/methylation domain-containing protein [Patescibacteria group bacterium]
MNRKNAISSFTLIELLIVVAIIGILAALIIVSLTSATARARDAQRLASAEEVQKALNEYYLDNGSYPQSGLVDDCNGDTSWTTTLGPALVPKYLASLPQDPRYPYDPWPFCFYYQSGSYGECLAGFKDTIIFATEISHFSNVQPYGVQGEGGDAARYCVQGN